MFNEYYLEEVEGETLEKKDTKVTEDTMTKLLEKLINQQQNYEHQNLQKISEKFILEKYSTKVPMHINGYKILRKNVIALK